MKYQIYQVPHTKTRDFGFLSFDLLNATAGFSKANYEQVWEGELEDDKASPDVVFQRFNTPPYPPTYKGRSLSVSDVVVIGNQAYYCDSFSWVEVNKENGWGGESYMESEQINEMVHKIVAEHYNANITADRVIQLLVKELNLKEYIEQVIADNKDARGGR